jgi:hypothetical protein
MATSQAFHVDVTERHSHIMSTSQNVTAIPYRRHRMSQTFHVDVTERHRQAMATSHSVAGGPWWRQRLERQRYKSILWHGLRYRINTWQNYDKKKIQYIIVLVSTSCVLKRWLLKVKKIQYALKFECVECQKVVFPDPLYRYNATNPSDRWKSWIRLLTTLFCLLLS